jgi:hypothetical protein
MNRTVPFSMGIVIITGNFTAAVVLEPCLQMRMKSIGSLYSGLFNCNANQIKIIIFYVIEPGSKVFEGIY